ncbi:hypothetical protein BT69DRAFT_671684 [Atractiella rhizophila]|nr:hypothetical protein BT69DRAFT_671684 [Atractiella rhizophila]
MLYRTEYYGRKDICLFAEESVTCLFPLDDVESPSAPSDTFILKNSEEEEPAIAPWLARILARTAIPDTVIFHALHLLRRLSETHYVDAIKPTPNFFHHRLLFTSLVLASKYSIDNCYTNQSFSIASTIFSLSEVNGMELSMLSSLEWRLRAKDEPLMEIILTYEAEWNGRLREEKAQPLNDWRREEWIASERRKVESDARRYATLMEQRNISSRGKSELQKDQKAGCCVV